MSDLAKYSMTQSIARFFCDSWATCKNCYRIKKKQRSCLACISWLCWCLGRHSFTARVLSGATIALLEHTEPTVKIHTAALKDTNGNALKSTISAIKQKEKLHVRTAKLFYLTLSHLGQSVTIRHCGDWSDRNFWIIFALFL